ncbi:DUF411 domain-containing protein [Pacificimonas flava]|uniref:CopG protein n=1 Tax=Pacificimonas flava TaxID=1234595 RepID=M2TNR8_9SPHN|nr:DUF411 domain-containing protein [Pacificimonas flava]EMD83361.1 CopG protein [Pacificimonas flava]MBB5279077.1 hypothetical protein [Pacificimonas flava]
MPKRKHFLSALAMSLGAMAIAGPALAGKMTMHRDPNCGCCLAWAKSIKADLGRDVHVLNEPNMPALKGRLAVPAKLASCHTAVIDGYIVEGHVPAADIARLLAAKPKQVRGLAVPGMPLGSPGMEAGGTAAPYNVIAFGVGTTMIFARHN